MTARLLPGLNGAVSTPPSTRSWSAAPATERLVCGEVVVTIFTGAGVFGFGAEGVFAVVWVVGVEAAGRLRCVATGVAVDTVAGAATATAGVDVTGSVATAISAGAAGAAGSVAAAGAALSTEAAAGLA